MGGIDGQGVQKSGLGLALFGDVLVSRMRRRLLAFGLSDLIPDFLWIGGEDGSQSFRELVTFAAGLLIHIRILCPVKIPDDLSHYQFPFSQ